MCFSHFRVLGVLVDSLRFGPSILLAGKEVRQVEERPILGEIDVEGGAILLRLQRADPAGRAIRRNLSQKLCLRGDAFQRAGEYEAALASNEESEVILEALRREDPQSGAYRRAQAYLHMETGNTLLAKGDAGRALEEYPSLVARVPAGIGIR